MPYFYLLLCNKPTRSIVQQPWIHAHGSITLLLYLKGIRDILQHVWVDAQCLITQLLHLILIRDIPPAVIDLSQLFKYTPTAS